MNTINLKNMKIRIVKLTILITMVFLNNFCSGQNQQNLSVPQSSASDENIIYVSQEDEQMNQAINFARSKLDYFIENLKNNPEDQYHYSVKAAFTTAGEDEVEHLWISEVTYDSGYFKGTISNKPRLVDHIQYGQYIQVPVNNVTDWLIVDEDGSVTGGYTIKVLRNRMSDQEREQFDRNTGFIFD